MTEPPDDPSFDKLTQPYRYELLVHCYRILGSLEDAEDGLQETLLRAWRRLDQLQDAAAIRAWLYKIATNVSLDMLKSRKARSFPHQMQGPADPADPLPPPDLEKMWIDPLPDFYLNSYAEDPEARQEIHEAVSLAFLTVLQHLPGRQRAVLLLRDVLHWRASEVADTLDMTVAAVNSALQRARSTLRDHQDQLALGSRAKSDDPGITRLLKQYVQAWEAADLPRLMALIHDDATLTMPPLPAWYRGRTHIAAFFQRHVFTGRAAGDFRMVPTRANTMPAFALYQRGEDGTFQLAALHILTIDGVSIARIDDFLAIDQSLFSRFKPLTD